MEPLTTGQFLTRVALFCAASLLVTGLLWLGARIAERRGWIVRRQEPIREWVEFGEATRNLGREVLKPFEPVLAWLARHLQRPG
jgi:hypothetical protein